MEGRPAVIVEVPTSFSTAHGVPGHGVIHTASDDQVAVRASPGLVLIRVGTDAGLNGVFDPAFDNRSGQT